MMASRKPLLRLAAAWVAVVFALAGARDLFAVGCPHHGSVPQEEPADHGSHHAPQHPDAGQSCDGGDCDHSAPCSCVGDCQSGSGPAAAALHQAETVSFQIAERVPNLSGDAGLPVERPAFLHPYSNGPPSTR